MALFAIRFDLRNPAFSGVSPADRWRTAVEMCEWADQRGAVMTILSEHHGSEDGYCPSPLTLAAAIAARTQHMRITIYALVAPLYHPIRLAEDVAAVDNLSGGRLDVTLTNGYVPSEFAMFGVPMNERAKRTTEAVETLRKAATGQPFEFRGETVRVTPPPAQLDALKIGMGGSTEPAAKRAARLGDSFLPSFPELWDVYRAERIALGKDDPGDYVGGDTSVVCLAEDVEQAWDELGPYFLHESNAYGAWMQEGGVDNSYRPATDVDALRATGQYRIVTPDEMVEELRPMGEFAFVMFHPMVGGVPPELAWRTLHLFEEKVRPALQ